MLIELKKFGTTLVSRQAGREALAAYRPNLRTVGGDEIIEVNFDGVVTLAPSWGDEFLTPLLEEFGSRLILGKTTNPSVVETLDLLEKATGAKYQRR